MKVCVMGLWHLGTVTAACLARMGHSVWGLDDDSERVARLFEGVTPLYEPGLSELVVEGVRSGNLRLTTDPAEALREAAVLWVAYDTPVDEDDVADVGFVMERVRRSLPHMADGALVLLSSQMPVGSARRVEAMVAASGRPGIAVAVSPENLRLGKAIEVFSRPDRVVVGVRDRRSAEIVGELLAPLGEARVEWMSVESAEMTKHALNAFLAMSIAFANEIAVLCEKTGADAEEVTRGLRSEARIGPKAYLSPGSAFGGGTLARDVVFLRGKAAEHGMELRLIGSVKMSNDEHKGWSKAAASEALQGLSGRRIAILGLTYKPGTDTLRRSLSVELAGSLADAGAEVRAFDPRVRALPCALAGRVRLAGSMREALEGAQAMIVSTEWPEFREAAPSDVERWMAAPRVVVDPNQFLSGLAAAPSLRYHSVGRKTPFRPSAGRFDLRGRRALVTGGTRGFGLAVASEFARCGASVHVCGRNADALARAVAAVRSLADPSAVVFGTAADVAEAGSAERLVAASAERMGGLDVLVSNAGVYGPKGTLHATDPEAWERAVEVNLCGPAALMAAAARHMIGAGRGGKIVQVSGGGATAPAPMLSAYAASKAAVVRLAEVASEELRPFAIDVNSVSPGAMNTDMLEEVLAAGPGVVGAELFEKARRQKASGGTPPEVGARLASFLASAASDGITGKLISAVWDRWEEFPARAEALSASDAYTLRRIVGRDRGMEWGDR